MDATQLRPSSPRIPLLAVLGCLLVAVPALIGVTSTSAAAATGQITGLGGKCVDVAAASSANGAAVQLYDCNGSAAQQWTVGTDGRKAITAFTFGFHHRTWVNRMPTLTTSDGIEYDKAFVVLYAYRHTYAQRHADAGVPIDVLRELMDHRKLDTTKQYYRNSRELHQTGEKSQVAS
jgi:hypothetical protein